MDGPASSQTTSSDDVEKLSNVTQTPVESVHTEQGRGEGDYPEGGVRAWMVVLGSFFLLFATFGFQTSVGLFQLYWSLNELSAYSPAAIAWIPSIFIFLSLALSIQIGALFDRYGPRGIMFLGSFFYVANFFLLARCTAYWHFMLCLGLLGGPSSAALITVAEGVLSHWFQKRRGAAGGVAMMGSALGGIIFPLILRPLLEKWGWAWAMQYVGFIILGCLIIANLTVRGRLQPASTNGAIDPACFLDARFNWIAISVFGTFSLFPRFAAPPNELRWLYHIVKLCGGSSC
jgi:MFS family permease